LGWIIKLDKGSIWERGMGSKRKTSRFFKKCLFSNCLDLPPPISYNPIQPAVVLMEEGR
jgi:hypothetical protein